MLSLRPAALCLGRCPTPPAVCTRPVIQWLGRRGQVLRPQCCCLSCGVPGKSWQVARRQAGDRPMSGSHLPGSGFFPGEQGYCSHCPGPSAAALGPGVPPGSSATPMAGVRVGTPGWGPHPWGCHFDDLALKGGAWLGLGRSSS